MNISSASHALPTYLRPASAQTAPGVSPGSPKESILTRLGEMTVDTAFFAANEIAELGKNDPALAMRYGATTISEKLLEGTGDNVRPAFNQAIIPTIRLAILGANIYRANETFKDPGSNLVEKGLDVARVATDLAGLAGSVMQFVLPAQAALGDTLVGVSYAADSVSHSIRGVLHGADRVKVWKKQLAEKKAAKAKAETPITPPPAVSAPVINSPLLAT